MRRGLILVALPAALALGAMRTRESRWPPAPLPPRRVVIVGDSVAHGAGDETRRGGIGAWLRGADVVNLGVDGARTANVLRVLATQRARAAVRRADAVVLSIGGNDLFGDSRARLVSLVAPRLAMRVVNARVAAVVARVRRENDRARIYVVGLYNPYARSSLGPWIDVQVARWDARLIARFATLPAVTVIRIADVLARPERISALDRFHPSSGGYRAIAARIAGAW
ncbi:MAG TPA: GDSL-type esterase/lipase family protein [Thermoanaerobaculia bacterium]|jgi:lysophospholipase L1-like esterase